MAHEEHEIWLGYADRSARKELARALRLIDPGATLSCASSAQELRRWFYDEEPGATPAIVGLSERGVSDMNLAAALVADGRASRVALVVRKASGSLRSRAGRAGISWVVDLDDKPAASPARPRDGSDKMSARRKERSRADEASGERLDADGDAADGDAADGAFAGRDAEPAGEGPRRPAKDARPAEDAAPVLCFVSGRGGVGKSTLVACCAERAASWGMEVAVVDLDLSCGNLFAYFGVPQGADLAQLAEGRLSAERMGRVGVRIGERVMLWGPCRRPEEAETFAPHVKTLIAYLRGRADLVLVDSSTTFTEAVARAIQVADRLMLVGSQEPGALASLARSAALAARLGVARTRMVRVENAADLRASPRPLLGRVEMGLEGARLFRVADGGDDVYDLLCAGEAAALANDSCAFSDSVGSMLAQLLADLGRLPDADEARRSLEARPGRRRFALFGRRKGA
ncbi:hypothetical protein [Olsenella sp. HMSC062G07]|uniref:nucleotide-binding protein n=1 Tax=Olsenella sp. HMSC062G07 TaxID=1739330 RepID=UPI0008A3C81F|nr:hypothetical protein [Olsenella sp. HMSC062G07]